MNHTGSIALASSLARMKGTPGLQLFRQFMKQPLQPLREYHNPCEPRHLSWQWRPKPSPNVNKCHKSSLKKKTCPEYRFFPRFKKTYVPQDIKACKPPLPQKPKTWSEYLSFLLPEEYTQKPKPTTCRKMLEHRRRQCMANDDYTRCIQGECWPLPTEWYGQGVLHVSELALSKQPMKSVLDTPCPPASNMITRCVEKNLPVCPGREMSCLDSVARKMPYSQFRAADTDGSPPTVKLNCPIKYNSELLPDHRQDKSFKLSCRKYGEFKSVECPKQMFNRYMSVDLNSKNLVPVPITAPGYTPQREVKKGVCGRQSLLRAPSLRNFSTGRAFRSGDYPEFIRNIDSSHLQPGRSPIRFDKLAGRAGMDTELLSKPLSERNSGVSYYNKFTEKELEKHEIEAKKDEEPPEQLQKKIDSSKSKLQLLIEKQEREKNKNGGNKIVKSCGTNEEVRAKPLFTRMVDLEDIPYQRSKFHSSAILRARKSRKEQGSKSSKISKTKLRDGQICSGCPGMEGAENDEGMVKTRCSTARGGAKGRCREQRPLRQGEKVSPLSIKCKSNTNSPCMRPRYDSFRLGAANRLIHLSQAPCVVMKERFIIDGKTSFGRDSKSHYSKQSKDLDQCCEHLDNLKKQIEMLKKESKDDGNKDDNAKTMLERCCEQMDQLKKQLESLQENRKIGKDSSDSKDLLDQCCNQQEELKKQIDKLKKSQGKGNKNQHEGTGLKKDVCEDMVGTGKKGDKKEDKKPHSQDDACKKDPSDCRKIKDKKERAEQCVQYLGKRNEKLKKAVEEMKKEVSAKSEKKTKEKCEELEKEVMKVEESKANLLKENEKLQRECESLKKELSKSSHKGGTTSKSAKKQDPCADSKRKTGGKRNTVPKSVCDKKPKASTEGVPEEVEKAMADCVRQCAKKAKKTHLKKELDKEKKKCRQELKQKQAAMKSSEDGDEGMLAKSLQGICCKLQDIAKKSKKKKKCCPCPDEDKKRVKECKEPYVSDLPCSPRGTSNNRKFHTSARTSQSACQQPKKTPESFETVEGPQCPPLPPKRKCAKLDFEHWNKPKLSPCPRPPGYVPKTKKQLSAEGCIDEEDKPQCGRIERAICWVKNIFKPKNPNK